MKRLSHQVRGVLVALLAVGLLAAGCSGSTGDQGETGPAGADGQDGTSCSVADNGDGTKTISCEDGTEVIVSDGQDGAPGADGEDGEDGAAGAPGEDGASCTVADNGDGTKTITCGETTVTVADGADGADGDPGTDGDDGESCTVADNGDGTSTITCGDTSVVVEDGAAGADGTSCTAADNGDGSKTITCGDTEITVNDGEGVDPDALAQLHALADVGSESCAVCHSGSGGHHQAIHDAYTDETLLVATIVSVVSVAGTAVDTFDTTVTFTLTWNGAPYVDAADLPELEQKRMMGIALVDGRYDLPLSFGDFQPTGTPGEYTATAIGVDYAIEAEDAAVYGYFADGELPARTGGRVRLYDNLASVAATYNDFAANAPAPTANVAGCEKCHGAPYGKHGYRVAEVTGLEDFAACKFCHYDTREGGHQDWLVLADDPLRYTQLDETPLTPEEEEKYAYMATVMGDTHITHAMEFPYPQSMANCATCHEGKLDVILADEYFVVDTCKSCHPIDGSVEYGTADHALNTIMPSWHDLDTIAACNSCHGTSAPGFAAYHSGYDPVIYADDAGTKYADLFVASVDSASLDGNTLTVTFSVTEDGASTVELNAEDVIPTILVGLYGWDTKDFIVGPHQRDDDRNRLLEFLIDGETTNPRFTVTNAAGGSWTVEIDLTLWADMLADGTVVRAEIGVMPKLGTIVGEIDSHSNGEHDDTYYAMNAVSRTFDLTTNQFVDGFYQEIIDVEGCNQCHDALGTTFHSPDRGGSIPVCRLCHITLNGGSHLEMQSRSIDSYAHAIHSFQAFDSGDVDMTDPVEKMRYDHHVEHTYPMFTLMACESCHTEGTYDVPDQSKSLPGVQSSSDAWDTERNIGTVPSLVSGPATRACGGCHRALLINEDAAGELAAFNQHTKSNGYLVEAVDGLLELVIENVMSQF